MSIESLELDLQSLSLKFSSSEENSKDVSSLKEENSKDIKNLKEKEPYNKNLNLTKNISYVSLSFSNHENYNTLSELIQKLIPEEELSNYDIQNEFHITVLFIGFKRDTRELEYIPLLNKEFNVTISAIAKSDDFIVFRVSFIDEEVPYYGNSIKHITIGKRKGKKLSPSNSPSAFEEEDNITILENPIEIKGNLIFVKSNSKV